MYSPNSPVFAHHSSDDDGDHAVFCFCGNEVEPDEEGDMGIYCSTACARKDALEALSSNHNQPQLSSSNSVPPGSFSYLNSTRQPIPSASCPDSLAYSQSGQVVFPPPLSEGNLSGLSPALSTASSMSSMASSEGMSSHYRRMEKERVALQRQRKKEREEAKQAAAHAAAMEILSTQRRIRQQRAEYHLRTASSNSISSKPPSSYSFSANMNNTDINSHISSGTTLSRNNTASSTSSTQSRYISTHPSRAKTPDLIHHGRNESLGSNTSSISSAASVAWGWGSRSGWGSQSREGGEEEIENPYLIREEDEELADDDLPDGHHQLPLDSVNLKQTGSLMKRSKANLSIVDALDQAEPQQTDRGGLKMGALLDDILDMERGFTVGGSSSPRSNVDGRSDAGASYIPGISPSHPTNNSTSTPRTHTNPLHNERSLFTTPMTDADTLEIDAAPIQSISTSSSADMLRTPNEQTGPVSKDVPPHLAGITQGRLKRPFVSTPPSSPHTTLQPESYVSRSHHPTSSSLSSISTAPSASTRSISISKFSTSTPPGPSSYSTLGATSSRPCPRLPTAPIPRPRRSTLSTEQHAHHLGLAHRRSVSTPFDISLSQPSALTSTPFLSSSHALSPRAGPNLSKKPKHRRSFSANEASSTAGWLEDSSSMASPLPPLPVIHSRPRTLVYSPEDSMGDRTVVDLSCSPSQSAREAGGLKLGWELPLSPPSLLGWESDIRDSRSTIQPPITLTSSVLEDENLNLAPPLMLGSDQESGVYMDPDEGRRRVESGQENGGGEGMSAWTRSGERLRAVLGWGDRD
ncbi:hypothetical protein [Phaffia rhodozyma]|uniref:Uncharacterized protein n=1 Tax=Phaffia rhodozyma TaxID=264483 RepID=A0A0F7STI8_PHARH|nr:hypothetical protein [Phaffia rhodozyma]